MFKILLLALLIGTNVGYAASAGTGAGTSLDAKIEALKSNPSRSLILVLGSTPGETIRTFTKDDVPDLRTFHSNAEVYTLGVRQYTPKGFTPDRMSISWIPTGRDSASLDQSRWLEVDFNNHDKMALLARSLKGRFKVICFDLRVLKFFTAWENLEFLKELLQDDGVLYVPDSLEDPSAAVKELTPAVQKHFTDNGFAIQIIKDEAIKIQPIKDLFQQSHFAAKGPTGHPISMDVLVAVKDPSIFPQAIKSAGEMDPSPQFIPPPYTELSALKVILRSVPQPKKKYTHVVYVSDVRTSKADSTNRPFRSQYYISIIPGSHSSTEEPLRQYILDGIFYSREDLINKILAAESMLLQETFVQRHIKDCEVLSLHAIQKAIRVGITNHQGTKWTSTAGSSGGSADSLAPAAASAVAPPYHYDTAAAVSSSGGAASSADSLAPPAASAVAPPYHYDAAAAGSRSGGAASSADSLAPAAARAVAPPYHYDAPPAGSRSGGAASSADSLAPPAVSSSSGAASRADPPPPNDAATAGRIIANVPTNWYHLETVNVFDINTTPGERGHSIQAEYTINTTSGARYILKGAFYGKLDFCRKVLAAEILRQRRRLRLEDFDFSPIAFQRLDHSAETSGNFRLRQTHDSMQGPPEW